MKNGSSRGINILGIHLSNDVLWLGGAAAVVFVGMNMMKNGGMAQSGYASYETNTPPSPQDRRTIEERVAAILERISAFKGNHMEARKRHREAIRAIVVKYRAQIVAVVMAFKVKLEQLRAANAPVSEFEKAKADVKIQIIDLIHLMQAEIKDIPRPTLNLDDVKKRVNDKKKLFEGLPRWKDRL